MEHPTGVDPPAGNAARFYWYTCSEEDDNQPAPTTDAWVASKIPMAMRSSQAGAAPTGANPGPLTGQGSASGSRAPKHCRLLRVVDGDDEVEEAAPTLVRRPRNRPDVVPANGCQTAEDLPPHTSSRRAQARQKQLRWLGVPGGGSSRCHIGAPTYKSKENNYVFHKVRIPVW